MSGPEGVPKSVKITGWVCLGLGLTGAFMNALVMLMDLVSPFPHAEPEQGDIGRGIMPLIDLAFAHRFEHTVVQLTLLVVFALAGWALARGSNWGRCCVLGCLGLWTLSLAAMGAQFAVMLGLMLVASVAAFQWFSLVGMAFAGFGLSVLTVILGGHGIGFYYAYRWLTGPTVVEACKARPVMEPQDE